jgi:hypothetical protein
MITRKTLCLSISFFCAVSFASDDASGHVFEASKLAEQLHRAGYAEMCDECRGAAMFDALYVHFDKLVEFLQTHPAWAQKLYRAKERFIRSPARNYYATDFFGFYDESESAGRHQISFYYSTQFHEFICVQYPEFNEISEIICFFEACGEIQKPCENIFADAAAKLGLGSIFSAGNFFSIPVLLKVIKYLPSYVATRPHYDGTAFSLFLDSTDNESLFLAPYTSSYTVADFSSPLREFSRCEHQNSMVLIPGALLAEFSLYPTPHIVVQSGKIRYATIAFALRPYYRAQKHEFSQLPDFRY